MAALVAWLSLAAGAWAQDSVSAMAPVTDPRAAILALSGREDELARRLEAVRATQASTQTAVEALGDLAAEVEALERGRLLLGQLRAELQESATLDERRVALDAELAQVQAEGPSAEGVPLAAVDAAEDAVEVEKARLPGLRSTFDAAQQAVIRGEEELSAAQRALAEAQAAAGSADPLRRPVAQARLGVAQARIRNAELRLQLRRRELANEQLALDLQRERVKVLEVRLARAAAGLRATPEDLAAVLLELERRDFDLARAGETAALELAAAEARWSRSRERHDATSEPDPALVEEVRARQQEVQSRQRQVTVLRLRRDRIEAMRQAWGRRYAVLRKEVDAAELPTWAAEARAQLAEVQRDLGVQSARLVEVDAERAGAGPRPEDEGKVARWRRERQRNLELLLEVARSNEASLREVRGLQRRLLDEVRRAASTQGLAGRARAAWAAARRWWDADVAAVARPLAKIALYLVLGFPLAFFLSRRVQAATASVYSKQSGMVAGKLVFWVLLLLLAIAVLNELGIGLGPLMGAAGVTGVALGFAAQTSVSNMISGLFLIAEQPFGVGEFVVVGDITGEVLSIDLLSVKLRMFDNKFVRIPNETILKTNVTNISRHPIRRYDMVVQVAYKEDIAKVRAALLEVAALHPLVLQNPEPIVIFQRFADSGMEFTLCVWGLTSEFLKLRNEVSARVKARFDEDGIEIPFPHLSLYRGAASQPLEVRMVTAAPAGELAGEGGAGEGPITPTG